MVAVVGVVIGVGDGVGVATGCGEGVAVGVDFAAVFVATQANFLPLLRQVYLTFLTICT